MGMQAVHLERMVEFFSFRYEFVAYALGASITVGVICALIGTFLVLRGLSLVGDALGHATLPGVAGAYLLVGHQHPAALLVGALVASVLAALAIGVFSRGPRVRPDAAIGIVLSVFFGAGVVLLAHIEAHATGGQAGLTDFLFGNAAAITADEFWWLFGVGLAVLIGVLLFVRPLKLVIFDPLFAETIGLSVSRFETGLLAAVAVAVVISVQSVGAILVAAMLIIPPSTGRLVGKTFSAVMAVSVLVGALSGALGAILSYAFEGVATGPAMVLVAAICFGLALIFGYPHGLFFGAIRRIRTREFTP